MIASDLKSGMTFCITKRSNARRYTVSETAKKPVDKITDKYKCPANFVGKYLIILDNCRQLILEGERVVYLQDL
jgi:hypothetical protein